MFAPYGYDALAGYLPPRGSPGARDAAPAWPAQLCGEDSRDIAGLDRLRFARELVRGYTPPLQRTRAMFDWLRHWSAFGRMRTWNADRRERPAANSKLLLERNLLEGRLVKTGAYRG